MEKTGTANKNKVLRILLVFVIAFSLFTTAGVKTAEAAANNDNEIMPCFKSILSVSYCITIDGIKAHVSGTILAQYLTDLQITLELQKYKKADGWYTVQLWAEAARNGATSLSGTEYINIFSKYRLRATFKADKETCTRIMYPED